MTSPSDRRVWSAVGVAVAVVGPFVFYGMEPLVQGTSLDRYGATAGFTAGVAQVTLLGASWALGAWTIARTVAFLGLWFTALFAHLSVEILSAPGFWSFREIAPTFGVVFGIPAGFGVAVGLASRRWGWGWRSARDRLGPVPRFAVRHSLYLVVVCALLFTIARVYRARPPGADTAFLQWMFDYSLPFLFDLSVLVSNGCLTLIAVFGVVACAGPRVRWFAMAASLVAAAIVEVTFTVAAYRTDLPIGGAWLDAGLAAGVAWALPVASLLAIRAGGWRIDRVPEGERRANSDRPANVESQQVGSGGPVRGE